MAASGVSLHLSTAIHAPRFRDLQLSIKKREGKSRSSLSNGLKSLFMPCGPAGMFFIASNAFLSQLVFSALIEGGLEFRGEIIRLVRTLRGGDRPKNAGSEVS